MHIRPNFQKYSKKAKRPNYFCKQSNFHNSVAKRPSSQPWLKICECGAGKISHIPAGARWVKFCGAGAGEYFQHRLTLSNLCSIAVYMGISTCSEYEPWVF